ncbi:class I SAM-dependent methyltransferase [Sphingobacterium corticibacter]|uniref:SAM-dependent methyltransferase n=1 Tax=Sphingobacterium corticibacter TaxID=2171749 RepID=A0A2T8HFW9_9SPHI|nr:class I SAM-dependent methyltransferase [Sphingobacterium corticibacter]PVH24336.1 SAM-dependent methyltransferase [Sphingobacterium corticibacter]
MQIDPYGEALLAEFHQSPNRLPLYLHTSYGDIDEMPIEVFFRIEDDFSELESIALALCDGHVLDVGAGAGAHALYLQSRQFNVTGLEISALAASVMQQRGVADIVQGDFFAHQDARYDTLLFLMNGIGIAGTLTGFRTLLKHSRGLLTDRGQLLFDTSDISYLYDDFDINKPDHYFGEITYQYEYNGRLGSEFPWLYLDQQKLIEIANEEGWVVQILFEDEQDQYLVRMEPRSNDIK